MNGTSIQLNSTNAQAAKDAAAASTQQQAPARNTQTHVGGTVHSVVYNQGKVVSSTSAAIGKGTTAPIQQVDAPSRSSDSSNVVAVKSSGGRALGGDEIKPDSVVEIGGMKTTVRGAEAAGFIARNAAGVLEYTSKAQAYGQGTSSPKPAAAQTPAQQAEQPKAPEQHEQQRQQEASDSKPVPLDTEGETLLQEFNAGVPSDVLVSGITQAIKSGELSPELYSTAAKHLGVTPEEATAKVNAFQASLTRQATDAVGPGAQAVFDWARTAHPEALQQAMHAHVHFGNLNGYKDLASRHLSDLDVHNPSLILNSEDGKRLNARVESNGRISLDTPKGRMGWSSWVRVADKKPHLT